MNNYSTSEMEAGKRRAGVLGYSGYSGAELVGLLEKHPHVRPILLSHRKADEGSSGGRPSPCSGTGVDLPEVPWDSSAVSDQSLDIVFTATPPEVSMEVIPQVLSRGVRAIDLSGAFRLSAEQYRRWYGAEHLHPELLKDVVYGLPELYGKAIRTACLVANPGCYPTAATLALWPLLQAKVVDRAAGVVCDAKSGVSGAGKKPTAKTHFVEIYGNFSAYGILNHRHVPEVLNNAGLEEDEFSFTAHLLPIERGILETHYLRLKEPATVENVQNIYRSSYQHSPFVRLYPTGAQPSLHLVNGTNFCDIHCTLGADGKRLVVISCIDNLVKGAAGQAVQNMNLMFGFDETAGLM
jgi:N-acetyl-gamma-glutamyl-phosphate reductase